MLDIELLYFKYNVHLDLINMFISIFILLNEIILTLENSSDIYAMF